MDDVRGIIYTVVSYSQAKRGERRKKGERKQERGEEERRGSGGAKIEKRSKTDDHALCARV